VLGRKTYEGLAGYWPSQSGKVGGHGQPDAEVPPSVLTAAVVARRRRTRISGLSMQKANGVSIPGSWKAKPVGVWAVVATVAAGAVTLECCPQNTPIAPGSGSAGAMVWTTLNTILVPSDNRMVRRERIGNVPRTDQHARNWRNCHGPGRAA
jgi:hypothetical protein